MRPVSTISTISTISTGALASLFILLLTTPARVVAQTCDPPPATLDGAPTFNVRDFGATGDHHSDDSAAIQAALDAAAAVGGGTVCFPRGTYVVRPKTAGGRILTLSSTHMRLVGEGIEQTTVQVGANSL